MSVPPCSIGPTDSSMYSMPSGANPRRSSPWVSRHCPSCSSLRAIPIAFAPLSSGAHMRPFCAPAISPSRCLSQPSRAILVRSRTWWGPVPWAMCWNPVGPRYFAAILDLFLRTDVTPALGSIQAPTLILRRRGDRHVTEGHARQLAERIRQARLVEFDGDDHGWFAGDTENVLNEIESFLTGGRSFSPANRVLSTVLFTDIVGSTERAAILGDQAWTTALAAHNRVVERHVAESRGAVVKFTGDGALATFDGPARAIKCALAIRDALKDVGLVIRAGLHSGEVEIVDNDVQGIAVHIAARIMALAAPGEVLVSGAIPPLVLGSRIAFANRGSHKLKGVPDSWSVLSVHP